MTRENKLALVVGFALILFVGILISDHFSSAQNQASADLSDGIRDPLDVARADEPGLVQYEPLTNTTAMNGRRDAAAKAAEPPAGTAEPEFAPIVMGNGDLPVSAEPERVGLDQSFAADLPFTYYQVRPGETLAALCRRFFGDPALATELASYNGIADPNAVTAGRRLRVPQTADVLIRGGVALNSPGPAAASTSNTNVAPAAASKPATPTYATYTIKKGDVLSKLSQQLLGTTRRMKELIELNRDAIKNPDRLIPGTVIKVPKK